MAIQQFDDLNAFQKKAQTWFSKVKVSDKEKQERCDLAIDYLEIMIMLFLMIQEQEYEQAELIAFTEERLKVLAERELGNENIAYINDWAKNKAVQIVNDTYEKYENEIEDQTIEEEQTYETYADMVAAEQKTEMVSIPELDIEIPAADYWLSNERALMIGLELASTVYNFKELYDAIEAGKTRKVWETMEDDRVRDTHSEVAGVDIPITEYFLVGNSYMLMPMDTEHGAEMKEIAGCRCHLVCY